jgi:hypothetical protein
MATEFRGIRLQPRKNAITAYYPKQMALFESKLHGYPQATALPKGETGGQIAQSLHSLGGNIERPPSQMLHV